MNFFADNYLIEERASKYYRNYIETLYAYNELNPGNLRFNEILDVPYPVFYDYLEYQFKNKKKEADKTKQTVNEVTTASTTNRQKK